MVAGGVGEVLSGRDRHAGNRTRRRSDTSIFRGSFSPVASPLLRVPHVPRPRSVFKTVPETKSRLSPFTPRAPHRLRRRSALKVFKNRLDALKYTPRRIVLLPGSSRSFPVCCFPFISPHRVCSKAFLPPFPRRSRQRTARVRTTYILHHHGPHVRLLQQ